MYGYRTPLFSLDSAIESQALTDFVLHIMKSVVGTRVSTRSLKGFNAIDSRQVSPRAFCRLCEPSDKSYRRRLSNLSHERCVKVSFVKQR